MNKSPFQYGTTVSATSFTNREEERKKLYNNFKNGLNTTIISPRRWGKSSLVESVVQDLAREPSSLKTVLIDLFAVASEKEFLEVFARECIKASDTKWENWIQHAKDLFKRVVPKFSLGVDPVTDFSVSFNWEELKEAKEEILNLPERLAAKKNIQFVICLDEFQNLASFSNYESLEKKMRAIWQRQKRVTYCLFGSKRHMMEDIFNNSSKPFYRFGEIMMLPKIKEKDWTDFITTSFENTGKEISESLARKIARTMKNHSWYVQQLAHYVWQMTPKTTTNKMVEAALKEVINTNSPLYQKEVEILSKTQLNLLKAIADGETKLTSEAVMRRYPIGTPRNISKNKAILKAKDIIDEIGDKFDFLDPAFEIWFKAMFD